MSDGARDQACDTVSGASIARSTISKEHVRADLLPFIKG
jgi:hypothetical protein